MLEPNSCKEIVIWTRIVFSVGSVQKLLRFSKWCFRPREHIHKAQHENLRYCSVKRALLVFSFPQIYAQPQAFELWDRTMFSTGLFFPYVQYISCYLFPIFFLVFPELHFHIIFLLLVTDEDTVKRYYAKFEEKFFQTCEKELAKINTFYSGNHV